MGHRPLGQQRSVARRQRLGSLQLAAATTGRVLQAWLRHLGQHLVEHAAAVVDQQHVAQGNADIGQLHLAVGLVRLAGDAQGEGQGVAGMPGDLGDLAVVQRVEQRVAAVEGAYPGQAHRVAALWVGIGRLAGERPHDFLQQQHIAHGQVGQVAAQGGGGGALRQTAAGIAPGMEEQLVVRLAQADLVHRLEHQWRGLQRLTLLRRVGEDARGYAGHLGVETQPGGQREGAAADLQVQPGAGVAAFV